MFNSVIWNNIVNRIERNYVSNFLNCYFPLVLWKPFQKIMWEFMIHVLFEYEIGRESYFPSILLLRTRTFLTKIGTNRMGLFSCANNSNLSPRYRLLLRLVLASHSCGNDLHRVLATRYTILYVIFYVIQIKIILGTILI